MQKRQDGWDVYVETENRVVKRTVNFQPDDRKPRFRGMKSRLIIGAVFSGEDRPNHGRAVGKDKNKQPRPIWGEKALLWKQKPKCLFLGKKCR